MRPALERLEDRWLPAATLTLNPVTLTGPVSAGLYSGPVDTFTETGRTGVKASDFQAVIDWGDHSPVSAGTVQVQNDGSFAVLCSHVYHEGSYFPIVTVTDEVADVSGRARGGKYWTGAAAMPTPDYELAAAAAPDGRIYAMGGYPANKRLDVYNPASDNWFTAADLPVARGGLAAVTGPDGRIYAIGGYNSAKQSTKTVEVYDTANNTWSTAASMPTARNDLAAVVGPNGRIYAIGGYTNYVNPVNTVEVYDPASNTWSTAAPMPTARGGLAAVVGSDGRIYAIGGLTDAVDDIVVNTVEVYDPVSNTWASAASMPTARGYLGAAPGPDRRIYALGGSDSNGNYLNTVEAYDPAGNTWYAAPPMPTARDELAAVAGQDGIIYAIGGYNGFNTLNTVEALTFPPLQVLHGSLTAGTINLAVTEQTSFDGTVVGFQTSNTLEKASDFTAVIHWGDGTPDSSGAISGGDGHFTVSGGHTYVLPGKFDLTVDINDDAGYHLAAGGTLNSNLAAPLSTARFGLMATTEPDGRIYVLGGMTSQNVVVNTVDVYDPTSNTWSAVAPMPIAVAEGATVSGTNGLIYVIGGYDDNYNQLHTVQVYNPTSNSWSTAAPLPTTRFAPAAVVGPDGSIYVFGGDNTQSVPLNTVDVYDPASNTWSSAAPMPTARCELAAALGDDGRIYVSGGLGGNSLPTNTVEVYDSRSNTWSTAASLPCAINAPAAAAGPDGRIYIIGGVSLEEGNENTVEAYDPTTNTWSAASSLESGRGYLAATAGTDGRIYAIGGAGNTGVVPTVEVLDFGPSAQVAPLPATHLVVSGFPTTVAGTPKTFTVTAEDAYGNTVTGYSGTVSFSASGVSTLPAPAKLTNGTGTFTATLFSGGLQSLAVTDGALTGAENDIIVTAGPVSTSISAPLTVSPGAPAFGQLVSVTARVANSSPGSTATPDGGFVIFSDNGRQIGVALLSNGTATIQTTFTGGSQYISATYTGAGNFLGSSTTSLTSINVTRVPTSAVLSTTPATSVQAGQSVTLSAQANGPAGMVTFFDGNIALGAVAVDVGSTVATLTVPSLSFGGHALAATFTPADILDYAPSTSGLPFTVTAAAPASIVVTSGSGQSVSTGSPFGSPLVATITDMYGDPVAGASVSFSAPPSGASATFSGGNPATTNALGQASINVQANNKGGTFSVLASVSGLNWASFSLTNLVATTTTLKANTPNFVFGQSAVLSASVAAPAGMARATGSVTFYDEGDALGTVPLVKGVAKLVVANLDVGTDSYTAVYSGNVAYATSGSATVSTTTAQAATRVKLVTSSASPQFGDTVTLTATLRAVKPASGIPTGTVTFMDGSSVLGTVNLVDEVATFSTSSLAVGGHTITAVYGGDSNSLGSASATLSETVAQTPVSVQLSASQTTAKENTPITFNVTVTPVNNASVAPTGTVTLYDNNKVIATLTLTNGTATTTISTLKKGPRPITAIYSGDTDFLGGTSSVVTVTIN
jgi:N-acetylneuraminic acid mutarotase